MHIPPFSPRGRHADLDYLGHNIRVAPVAKRGFTRRIGGCAREYPTSGQQTKSERSARAGRFVEVGREGDCVSNAFGARAFHALPFAVLSSRRLQITGS
jgi:hypothetical protein